MDGKCSTHGKNSHKIFIRKYKVTRPLVKRRRRWEANIKTNLVGCDDINWIHLAQDRDQ
jgi:hypothetical protein